MTERTLKMREFEIDVLVVQPIYLEQLGLAKTEWERRKIQGYTLEDAKKRAGIS